MHNRVLTADNMSKRNRPCNPICRLCLCTNETTSHLLTECNFSEAVWDRVASTFNLPNYSTMRTNVAPAGWVNHILAFGNKEEKKKSLGVLFTCWWMIWKERNRRTFDHKEITALQLSSLICDEVRLLNFALSA
ncbi:hypothetical protein PR202_ga23619 [Eleusine coracana subsp. coracana]|uniref:Reverse transcriptase zinc-binding domain-containing protein n=1 Tax=Eleusine coracana subsp. coracana TaxID=191504 RepID=A0AAV5D6N3_ELECO|nr:hypothetical protein PR202_ga23619 [Eleusine coracana subsp. coracana]